MTENCVCCGREIPEGRMVCPLCEKRAAEERDFDTAFDAYESESEATENKKSR